MKNKLRFAVNIILVSIVFVLNYFYQRAGFNFTLKCVTSSLFALLAVINLSGSFRAETGNIGFDVAMATGLILAFFGDVLIGYNFIVGAAVFALGHIFFIAAYCFIKRFDKTDFALSFVLSCATMAFLLLYPYFNFGSQLVGLVCVMYAFIISFMVGKSCGNFISCRNLLNAVVFFASCLFIFSDFMLVLGRFTNLGTWVDNACMATYYPAVCFLAFSMYLKNIQYK